MSDSLCLAPSTNLPRSSTLYPNHRRGIAVPTYLGPAQYHHPQAYMSIQTKPFHPPVTEHLYLPPPSPPNAGYPPTPKMASLPPLPEVHRLSPTCIRLLAGNPSKFTLQGTNTYLLGTGRSRLLIDTGQGVPSWLAALRRTLAAENATVTSALLTHWHPDHVGGVADLLSACPDAQVYKHTPDRGQLPIVDGQRFVVEGATLTAVYTPGHTADHVVFLLGEEGAMFTGDNVLGHGTGVFEDLGVYLKSLERMAGLFEGVAYPGHGEVVQDGPGRTREYIRHRKMREDQVVKTMQGRNEAGDGYWWTAMELVKVIYRDVPESLHGAAAAGVVQILGKLETEGKVVSGGERWRLTDRSAL